MKIDLYNYFGLQKTVGTMGVLEYDENCVSNGCKSAMLVIAGGGYDHVSSREQQPVADKYFQNGFLPFILHYSTKVPYPVSLIEGCLAMAFIRLNAKQFGVEKVAGVGFSAGGHLLGLLGIAKPDVAVKNTLKSLPLLRAENLDKMVVPDAIVLSYPVITSASGKCHQGSFNQLAQGNNRLISRLSLEKRVHKSSAPSFIWHTRNDASVPVYGTIKLAEKYERNGLDFCLHIYEKGKHGLSVATSLVNDESVLSQASSGIEGWLDLSVSWLKDRGF